VRNTIIIILSFFLNYYIHPHNNVLMSRIRSPATCEPLLIRKLLQTLAVFTECAGVRAPDLAREYWDLLLSLRHETDTMDAVMHGLVVLCRVCSARDLAENHTRELAEARAWVAGVVESRMSDTIKSSAVLALVALDSIMDGYRRILLPTTLPIT
jgi:hypothetical protein